MFLLQDRCSSFDIALEVGTKIESLQVANCGASSEKDKKLDQQNVDISIPIIAAKPLQLGVGFSSNPYSTEMYNHISSSLFYC